MDARRPPRLSLDLLRGFRAAARHLSFTRAARELCVTQPAVSREIRTLEEQLGKPLFRRVGRGLQLTQAGRELYAAVEEGLATIDEAVLRIASTSRTLSLTTTVALASTWLVPRLPRFARSHPEIDMRLVASNDAIDLEREVIDVAIRYVPADASPRSEDRLFGYALFPVCAPALAADAARPLRTLADLSRHVLIDFETLLYGRPWYDWQQWSAAMELRRVEPAGWLRVSHYDQAIEAAINGSGVAVGKWPHLAQHLSRGALVAPLGAQGVAWAGAFYVEVATSAQHDVVDPFVHWLHAEALRDARARRKGAAPIVAPPDGRVPSANARRPAS